MPESMTPLVAVGVIGALFILLLSLLTNNYSLNNIKSKTVGDGQYGTARWATDQEIRKAYVTVPFDVASWRAGKRRPTVQGLVLGSVQHGKRLDALVDRDDVHCLMIGASGVGKTAFFLYPNLEFACASGMSYLALDIQGRPRTKLRHNRKKILRLPRFRDRSAQPDALGREQSADAHQPLHGHRAGAARTTLQHGRMQKNMRRSSPKPSSIRAATSRIVDRTRTSMTQQRACWQP